MPAAERWTCTNDAPRSVGQAYEGEAATLKGAGTLYMTPAGKVLLLRRGAEGDHKGKWCLPGGGIEADETAEQAAQREAVEELGTAPEGKRKLFDHTLNEDGVDFSTFVQPVPDEFQPTLNDEHTAAIWAHVNDLPAGLHPGLESTMNDRLLGGDMDQQDWDGLVNGFLKWVGEEEAEEEHADDEIMTTLPSKMFYSPGTKKFLDKQAGDAIPVHMAMDRGLYDRKSGKRIMSADHMALDFQSVRSYDADGHLKVVRTPISKANVCEYYGHEIPGGDEMGLDPRRKYRLLRHPDELKKAAASSNGKQLLMGHTPVNVDDHQPDVTVGAVGTNAEYVHPYLYNSLSVWAREGIEGIETGEQKELSSAYRYRADMTPGTYLGVPYDGVMRDIDFNHVALVPEGRAGADVVVGDSQIDQKEISMSKVVSRFAGASMGALAIYLKPKLAQDAKLDLSTFFEGVTAKNFKGKKAKIAEDIKAKAKLAQDANLDDVMDLLDKCEGLEVAEGADADPSSGLPMNAAEMAKKAKDEKRSALDEFLKGKLSAEDKAACDELMGETDAEDEEDDEDGKKKPAEDAEEDDKEPKVTKKAMDAAIAKATKLATDAALKTANEISEAKDVASKWVGRIAMDAVSPAEVFKLALDHLKVDVTGIHESAYRKILEAQPLPGARDLLLAQDHVVDMAGVSKRFGDITDRIALS